MDVVIIGAGIMGVTFAHIAKTVDPKLNITILERLDQAAGSNSSVFNNAGTGHEANCELNYTPVDEEVISVEKALDIHAQFNVAKQYWANLVKNGIIKDPESFIHPTKHCTLVNEDSINLLHMRYKEMASHHFFDEMKLSEDFDEIQSWIPLTMEGRSRHQKMAATRVDHGTDVNFESITKQLAQHMENEQSADIQYNTHVKRVHKSPSGSWLIECEQNGVAKQVRADKLFVGAGGGAFPILKASHLPAGRRFSGFPVGGRFLAAEIDKEVAQSYGAKTYGKAAVGAPPMSVPHLDLRVADGKYYLLFGPFATFSPILEKGRGIVEFIRMVHLHDIPNLLNVAREHFPLVTYLFKETFKGESAMLKTLDEFAPGLSNKFNWKVVQAGQRVQIIKDGDLQMGTEIVTSEDLSYGTLLGASPGASVSPEVMLRCVKTLFPKIVKKEAAQERLKTLFDETDVDVLIEDADKYREIRNSADKILGIREI
ncbi:malate:quinone oxidoreductase [Oleiphilus sp. HI0009]|nr:MULTISPECIES: malate:quinone oxidoreductase [unclassified Oleiphilus]KZX75231.1 malate:quinone oxidoreductase [Oleiphilus sp. HI0009]KZY69860.1 malate:quinone oxidoreductase [Oleiphilus sp. HI0067]KZY72358.1 malate:quinone oxidoreductase [Oleiphilus sp. HI0066]